MKLTLVIKTMLINYNQSLCGWEKVYEYHYHLYYGKEMVDKYCTLDNQLMDHSWLPCPCTKEVTPEVNCGYQSNVD